MEIGAATTADWPAIWRMLEPVIRAGEVYALPRDMAEDAARAYWFAPGKETFVAEAGGQLLGTYYIHPNQAGGGSHVANCGYLTGAAAQGRGVAQAMCEHSQAHARARGYRAMQFNFVISTNVRAVALWTRLGFATVGRLPGAFHHPSQGFVDALVMFKPLA
jgi:L-amino acid N-acyltransferase YncA